MERAGGERGIKSFTCCTTSREKVGENHWQGLPLFEWCPQLGAGHDQPTLAGRVFPQAASQITPAERNDKPARAGDKRWVPEQGHSTLWEAHSRPSRASFSLSRQTSPRKDVRLFAHSVWVCVCGFKLQGTGSLTQVLVPMPPPAGAKGHCPWGWSCPNIYSAVKQWELLLMLCQASSGRMFDISVTSSC